jgi:AcrR family transcriptional regulator
MLSPLNKEQFDQIRDERKEQLIGAALKVFSSRGIIGSKISMIAAEAGVSQGLFYHYFKSKDELFTSLVQEALEASLSSIDRLYQVSGSPKDKIKFLTESILDKSGAPYFRLIHQARTSDGIPVKAKQLIEQYSMKIYVDRLLPLFKEGQQAGEIAAGNLEELISIYLSVLSGVMVLSEDYRIPDASFLLRILTKNG